MKETETNNTLGTIANLLISDEEIREIRKTCPLLAQMLKTTKQQFELIIVATLLSAIIRLGNDNVKEGQNENYKDKSTSSISKRRIRLYKSGEFHQQVRGTKI